MDERIHVLVTAMLLGTVTDARAGSVTLAWDPNAEADLAGYVLRYGTASGLYNQMVDVGNVTTNTIAGLAEGITYFFAVTAYNTAGLESDFSNEVSYSPASTTQTNAPPTVDPLSDITLAEDSGNQTIMLSGISSGSPAELQTLEVIAFSSNPNLIPAPSVNYISPNSGGSLNLGPLPNASGTATITVTVDDGAAVSNRISRTFVVTVVAVNDPPVISAIVNQVIDEDTSTGAIPFTVTDVDNDPTNLVVTASASDAWLVPPQNILLGGNGTARSIQIWPGTNQFGTTIITVTVNDGSASSSSQFGLTVNSVNEPPVISTIPGQTVSEDTATGAIGFTVQDVETPASILVVSAHSSNLSLVPDVNISLGGAGTNRTVTVLPTTNQFGTTTITLTVSDGQRSSSSSFALVVTSVNDPPTISSIADQNIAKNSSTGPLPLIIGDVETAADALALSARSSKPSLISPSGIVFGGSGTNRTVTVTPGRGKTGSATITLSVSDGGVMQASTSFIVNVGTAASPALALPELKLTANRTAGKILLIWESSVGATYRVLWKNGLDDASWAGASSDIVAGGLTATWTESIDISASTRFYQVILVQ